MKTILEPKNSAINWWHGVRLTCPECGAQFELEPGDELKIFWMSSQDLTKSVSVACAFCCHTLTAKAT